MKGGERRSLRERKKARTRSALTHAAVELFEDKGFEATTVDEIAEVAGVSRRTFFRYFETKEAVVFPDHADRIARFRELVAEDDAGGTPLQLIGRALVTMAEEWEADRDAIVAQQRVIIASPALIARERVLDLAWEKAFADVLVEGVADDEGAQRRARMLAGAVIGVVRVALREWHETDGRGDLRELGREAMSLLAGAFST